MFCEYVAVRLHWFATIYMLPHFYDGVVKQGAVQSTVRESRALTWLPPGACPVSGSQQGDSLKDTEKILDQFLNTSERLRHGRLISVHF